MSLFSSIRMAGNTLQTDQIAMQVIGQNIANANTPGYIREEAILAPAGTQRLGNLLLGMGVQAEAIVQKIDRLLEERLRGAVSDRASAETQEEAYLQLEGVIGELSEIDLSTSMVNFFSSISEILNDPSNTSTRNLAVLQGVTLTADVTRLAGRARQMRSEMNSRVQDVAERVNRLTEEIRTLNLRIADAEGGDVSNSDAVGLRDRRLQALEQLSELIDIQVREQPSGTVAVYTSGIYLVFDAIQRPVDVVVESDRGLSIAQIHLEETDSPINASAGELHGLLTVRDEILGQFVDDLDEFSQTLTFEFNRIYSGGQGLNGFQQLTSEFFVDDADADLDQAGLAFSPENGSFEVLVHNKKTGLSQTTDIRIDLNGLGNETSLTSLAAALDAVDGMAASVTSTGELSLQSESSDLEFAFANDTSGALAALGLNTFFSGSSALDVGVNQALVDDPAKFAASRGGIGADTDNAIDLAAFLDRPLASKNDASLSVLYDGLVAEVTQGSSLTRTMAEGARTFEQTLRGQKLATSGVSIDEEAVRLIAHQRSFQASARFISTLDELMGILVAL